MVLTTDMTMIVNTIHPSILKVLSTIVGIALMTTRTRTTAIIVRMSKGVVTFSNSVLWDHATMLKMRQRMSMHKIRTHWVKGWSYRNTMTVETPRRISRKRG